MSNYGIKISRPGFDVNTAGPQELAFSSAYKTLKINSQGSGTLTNASRTATIAHNLGYVPVFMVHSTYPITLQGAGLTATDYVLGPVGDTNGILYAYADSTNLYIKAQSNFGVLTYGETNPSNLDECVAYEDDFGYTTGYWVVGNDSTFGQNVEDGAIRFGPSGIALTQGQSISSAQINFYIGGRRGSGEVKMRIYGIDEDNTGAFNSGTAATARAKTTAFVDHNTTLSVGNTSGKDVTSIVQEIINRGGWSSGNKIGFILNDNGTTASNDYYEGTGTGEVVSTLEIVPSDPIASYKYTIFLNQLE